MKDGEILGLKQIGIYELYEMPIKTKIGEYLETVLLAVQRIEKTYSTDFKIFEIEKVFPDDVQLYEIVNKHIKEQIIDLLTNNRSEYV